MIFLNGKDEILLFLRDNKLEIKCPNMWDLPGGGCEDKESAERCIQREMREELPGVNLGNYKLFTVENFEDRVDSIFWTRTRIPIDCVNELMTEGQRADWFTRERVNATELAFGFGPVVQRFYDALREGKL